MANVTLMDPILGVKLEIDEEIAPLVRAIHNYGGFIIEARKVPGTKAPRGNWWNLEFSKIGAMHRLLLAIKKTEPDVLPRIGVDAGLVESGRGYTTIAISLMVATDAIANVTRAAQRLRPTGRPRLKLVRD